MAELVLVADGAVPHDDYGFLPEQVKAWCGYVGGHTSHAWTKAEVEHLEATGLPWWAIWTAVQGRALTADDVDEDVAGMLAGLTALGRPKQLPVIYDVEYSTWAANPHSTTQHAQDWCARMRAAGYRHAWWYGPAASVAQWRAHWGITKPATLGAGVLGVQYDHDLADGRYDISVFNPALFTDPKGLAVMTVEYDALTAQLVDLTAQVHALHTQLDQLTTHNPQISALHDQLDDKIDAAVSTLSARIDALAVPRSAPDVPTETPGELG